MALLVIRPGRACRVVSGHLEVVGGIGAQAGDREPVLPLPRLPICFQAPLTHSSTR